MYWGKKTIAGTVYGLTHLDPFIMSCPRTNAPPLRVKVEFGSHTFTESVLPHHGPDLIIRDGGKRRAFCLKRYVHSLHLPAAVQHAVGGDVHLSNGRMVLNATVPGLVGPYLIAFNLRAQRTRTYDAVLTVVSAHHRPNLNQQLPRAKFTAVLSATLAGAAIRWKP